MKKQLFGVVLGLAFLGACSKPSASDEKSIWIYSSCYKEVLAIYEPYIQKLIPGVKINWFQAGSENIGAKVLAELSGQGTQADILITSDLFFYQELKKQGHFLPLDNSSYPKLPTENLDPDKAFAVSRFPVMVLAYNTDVITKDPPKSYKDLVDPRFKGLVSMGSPLESGTSLTSLMYLHDMMGADYFKKLRANDVIAAGGNGATMARLQSGERPVGMILMENVLQAEAKGQKNVKFVLPEEGVLALPSPIAIFKSTKHPEIAQKIVQWFLSEEAQDVVTKGLYYGAYPQAMAPAGAPAWNELKKLPWSLALFDTWGAKKQEIKDEFQSTVLR